MINNRKGEKTREQAIQNLKEKNLAELAGEKQ